MLHSERMQVESAELASVLFFETKEEIYARVFRQLKPRTRLPRIEFRFRDFANANSTIRLQGDLLTIQVTDLLEPAPAPVHEALAHILLGKLYRLQVPASFQHRYRLYLNRKDVRRDLERIRRIRGRKFLSGAQGAIYDLRGIFDELNLQFFGGLMSVPELGWSRTRSRTLLGHYDSCHHAIVISRLLDDAAVPRFVLEYVLYHEMLHLRHPVEHRGARRCVHTEEFRAAERLFPRREEAEQLLKKMACRSFFS